MKQTKQNKIFAVGFFLVVLVIIWSLARPFVLKLKGGADDSEEKINAEILKAPLITPEDLNFKMATGETVFIVDLRDAVAFENSHIPASRNSVAGESDLQKIFSGKTDKNSNLIFVSQEEKIFEAAKTTNDFISKGYFNAKYLQGGFPAWQKRSFAVVSGGSAPSDEAKVKIVNTDQLIQDLNIGEDTIQFLDVRDPESFQKERIRGAINIPIRDLETNLNKISGIKKIIVYGKDEEQSKKAAVALFDLNYFNVYVLEGNIEAIKNAGR